MSLFHPLDGIGRGQLSLTKPTILVLGNEGHGLRTNVLRKCDVLVTIPTLQRPEESGVDSLNVSVAGGILMQSLLLSRPA